MVSGRDGRESLGRRSAPDTRGRRHGPRRSGTGRAAWSSRPVVRERRLREPAEPLGAGSGDPVSRFPPQSESGVAMIRIRAEEGVALAMAVMTMLLLSAAAAALLLISSSETAIAAHFRSSVEAQYAAEATMVRVIGALSGVEDWAGAIAGAGQSALVDGPPVGTRVVPGGSTMDLVAAVNLANCRKPTTCSA